MHWYKQQLYIYCKFFEKLYQKALHICIEFGIMERNNNYGESL